MSSLKKSNCHVYKTSKFCNKFKENCVWKPLLNDNTNGKCVNKRKISSKKNSSKKISSRKIKSNKNRLNTLQKKVTTLESLQSQKARIINKNLKKQGLAEEFTDILNFVKKYPNKTNEEIVNLFLEYDKMRKIIYSGPYTKKPDWSGSWNSKFHHSHWRSQSSNKDEGGGGKIKEENSKMLYKLSKRKPRKFKVKPFNN